MARAALLAVLAGAGSVWLVTAPDPLPASSLPAHRSDPANGRTVFHAASCMACHGPDGQGLDPAGSLPSGGAPFATPVGTFYPGNLTPEAETGLGRWSAADFVNAVTRGISPDGRHYLPAFPYGAYRFLRTADVLDLFAYLRSLPAVHSPRRPPTLRLEPLVRRGVGLWKRLALGPPPFAPDATRGAAWSRGAYLVNAPGHCGECHTPRDALMRSDVSRSLAGGPHPSGEGRVPSLRRLVARGRYTDPADLVAALQFGETLGYDHLSSGGMGRIQSNLALLPEADLSAMAEYLTSLE